MSAPRVLDMKALLAAPPKPVRYRVDQFAQDGALTLLCGVANARKSWLLMQMCSAVELGRSAAGIRTEQGTAVYVDGEMGPRQMKERFRDAGFAHDAFGVIDAQGMNVGQPEQVKRLAETLHRLGAKFVAIDSLRRLSPGRKENDSDDMAPLVGGLAVMAREIDAAVVLIHHSGHSDHFARGSTAICDQSDALFGLIPHDSGDSTRLELTCAVGKGGKFRFGREPEPRWMRLAIGETPGVVVVVAANKKNGDTTTPKKKDVYEAQVREILRVEPTLTKGDVAERIGVSKETHSFRDGWNAATGGGYDLALEGGATTTDADLWDGLPDSSRPAKQVWRDAA